MGPVFALIVLWYATELRAGCVATWLARPWYRKAAPSFADMVATLRQQGLAAAAAAVTTRHAGFLAPPCPQQRHQKARRVRHLTRAIPAQWRNSGLVPVSGSG